jgi:two-component system chemotaxis response regulator CheB
MVVDNSVFVHRTLREVLEREPDMEVVGAAYHGAAALEKWETFEPDVMVLDVDMPVMDGIAVLKQLRDKTGEMRIIMYSGLTARAASVTLEALRLGADDYAPKGDNDYSSPAGLLDAEAKAREELVPKIRQFFDTGMRVERQSAVSGVRRPPKAGTPNLLALAASTGGPGALSDVLGPLPGEFPQPVVIVQHMPAAFTPLLAKQLNSSCEMEVQEARHGQVLAPGHVYLAPGDFHMRVVPQGHSLQISLDASPPLHGVRPAADVLFRSLAGLPNTLVLAAVLTGMGRDGTQGAADLKAAGATVVAQDEASSVVWGMPGSVVQAGLADFVVPLEEMGSMILQRCMPHRSAA